MRHGVKNWVGIPSLELDILLEQIIVDPTLFLSEMASYLHGLGYKLHTTSQIWQALKSRGFTRKVLEVHAKEQDEIRRQNFLKMTSIFTAEQRFYVDERYKCNNNFNLEAFYFTTISLRIQLLRNSSISMLPIYLATSFLSQDISIVLPLFLLDLLSSSYYFFLLCLNLNNLQILSNTKLASDFSL